MDKDDKINPRVYPNLYRFMTNYETLMMKQRNERRLKDEFGDN